MSYKKRNKGGNKGKVNSMPHLPKRTHVSEAINEKHEEKIANMKVVNGLKTLIVFDTNVLRDMLGKEVAYNSFTFGKAYEDLKSFISESKLEDYVTLSVSTMVIEELKNQKKRAYKQDIAELKEIVSRLEGLPHIAKDLIVVPDEDFDCGAFIEQSASDYIKQNDINTLTYKDEHASSILNNMVQKVVSSDKPKSPFAISGPYKDAGFKDGIIWETLMHFEAVQEYDKVIFLSKDGDYKENCLDDFRTKWNRHIKIEKDKNNVIAELKKDYSNYIAETDIYEFARDDYFKEYLFNELKVKTEISINDSNFKIENFEIIDTCKVVNRLAPDEEQDENVIITSEIKVFYSENTKKKEQIVEAKTTLADDETKEIITTDYNFELI